VKKIALIGKPNVGKSSLYNRLLKRRDAITSDVSGTTRDIKQGIAEIEGKEAIIIDTGGLDDSNEIFEKVKQKSLQSAKESDIVLFMVDGKILPDDNDKKIFFELQKINPNIALVVNKIDNDKMKDDAWEFLSFGCQDIFFISVSHNRGVNDLISWLTKFLDDSCETMLSEDDDLDITEFLDSIEQEDDESNELKVAIIGRVNVGKSSLLNGLLNEERAVVSSIAGTTIDPVDEVMEYDGKLITFVDTAGIRRRGKIEGIEKFALNRTQKMLENADVALLVLDSSQEFTELDERIASLVQKYELATIIVLNKWDKRYREYKESIEEVRDRFKFLAFAPIITVSAKTSQRVYKINDLILKVYNNYKKRVPTSHLNQIVSEAIKRHQIPTDGTKIVKIYFATQFGTKPPKIALISNRPKSLHFSYIRYLANFIRKNIDLEGTPLVLIPRKKGERVEDEE
jgi:GTP-binding protein